jgi:hypothetical protein
MWFQKSALPINSCLKVYGQFVVITQARQSPGQWEHCDLNRTENEHIWDRPKNFIDEMIYRCMVFLGDEHLKVMASILTISQHFLFGKCLLYPARRCLAYAVKELGETSLVKCAILSADIKFEEYRRDTAQAIVQILAHQIPCMGPFDFESDRDNGAPSGGMLPSSEEEPLDLTTGEKSENEDDTESDQGSAVCHLQ